MFGGVTAIVSVPLGVWVQLAALRDRALIAQGRMDPAGKEALHDAGWAVVGGFITSVFFAMMWAGLYGLYLSLTRPR